MKKQNFFSGIEISNPEQFVANENMVSMAEMIDVYNAQKNIKKLNKLKKHYKNIEIKYENKKSIKYKV